MTLYQELDRVGRDCGSSEVKAVLGLATASNGLRALPVRRDYELTVNFSLSVEPQADSTSAKDALEQQVGNALNVCHKIRRTLELVSARSGVGLSSIIIRHLSTRHVAWRRFVN